MTLSERIRTAAERATPCTCAESRRIAPHSVAEHGASDASRVPVYQSPYTRRALAGELPGKVLR